MSAERPATGGPTAEATEIGVKIVPRLAEPPIDRVGQEIAGYRVTSVLGQGGMGIVYRAEHLHLQRTVALKLLAPTLAADPAFRARFVREARDAATLTHPNIVAVYDAGEAGGLLYIAMELVEGEDLAVLIERERLQPVRAVAILEQVAAALDSAHARGLVHRDVKPANILIGAQRCYLSDFGLTKRLDSRSALTAVGQLVGTVDYVAPEQIEGGELDARTDVYALGCVLYHCLTGAAPYQMDSDMQVLVAHLKRAPAPLRDTRPDLPLGLDDVIGRAMAKARDDRYASCGELMSAARSALGGADATTPATAGMSPAPASRVIVVGTAADTRSLVRAALALAGYEIVEAPDAAGALALAAERSPELVVVDGKPGQSGTAEACRMLRGDEFTSGARILVVRARSQAAEREAFLAAGADDDLAAPFSALQLSVKARDLLSLPRDKASA